MIFHLHRHSGCHHLQQTRNHLFQQSFHHLQQSPHTIFSKVLTIFSKVIVILYRHSDHLHLHNCGSLVHMNLSAQSVVHVGW